MNYEEFKIKVSYNTERLKETIANNGCLTTLLSQVYTINHAPGECHSSVLMRNSHDIIPSLYLGALASTNNNGTDAYIVKEDDSIEGIEIKTSEFDSQKVWKGPQGGLCIGLSNEKNRYSALTSKVAAAYDLKTQEILKTKCMRTVMMITDTSGPNTYLDAWEIDGRTAIELLSRTTCNTRNIKFGSFLKYGQPAKTTVPLIGFQAYKQHLNEICVGFEQWQSRTQENDLTLNEFSVNIAQ
jgi:hypothetical protein